MKAYGIPKPLKGWFVVHFIVDTIFAIPLFFAPVFLLTLLNWKSIDPLMARMVAAALFGIGIGLLLIFAAFNILWIYRRLKIRE